MRTTSPTLAGKFRDIVDRVAVAFHEQREIEARRALQRYRHLLEAQRETSPLNEIIPVCNEEDASGNAHESDARERAAGTPAFERA
jgi:hypothetical protein